MKPRLIAARLIAALAFLVIFVGLFFVGWRWTIWQRRLFAFVTLSSGLVSVIIILNWPNRRNLTPPSK